MKRITLFFLALFAALLVAHGSYAEDYYGLSDTPPAAETTQVPAVTPYAMPATPIVAQISSATPLLLQATVGSTEPTLCILEASDKVYLNGTLATPSLGIPVSKETPTLVPIGKGVTVVTSSDTVSLKILPIK